MLRQTDHLSPVLQAIVALDAWNTLEVLQHARRFGRYPTASILRQAGITTRTHLAAINSGLKNMSVDRRRHCDREVPLRAVAQGFDRGRRDRPQGT